MGPRTKGYPKLTGTAFGRSGRSTALSKAAMAPHGRSRWSAHGNGGEGWIRTSVRLRGQIYSLLPLTTRPPLQGQAGGPDGERIATSQRVRIPGRQPAACLPPRSSFRSGPLNSAGCRRLGKRRPSVARTCARIDGPGLLKIRKHEPYGFQPDACGVRPEGVRAGCRECDLASARLTDAPHRHVALKRRIWL